MADSGRSATQPGLLLLGDCLDIMSGLPLADLVCTDPPYFLHRLGDEWREGGRTASQQVGLAAGMAFDRAQGDDLEQAAERWAKALPVKPGAFVVAFGQARLVHRMVVAFDRAGYEIRDQLAWHYGKGQGKAFTLQRFAPDLDFAGRKTPQFTPQYEPIMLAQAPREGSFVENWAKHRVGLIDAKDGGQLFSYPKPNRAERVGHPTQKPVALVADLIRRLSLPGQLVLDPFMGSGTTGVAALQEQRRFIGIERDARYFEMARKRIADASLRNAA